MRSAEHVLALACVTVALAGCSTVKAPIAAVQETVAKVIPAAAPAASAPAEVASNGIKPAEAPVDARAQRSFDEARAAMRAGRAADAERILRQLAAQHPELGGVHANLGVLLRNAGKLDESVSAFEQAVKASPDQPVIHNQLGVTYRMKGQFAKARAAYERAIELDAGYADAHLNLGILLDLYLGDSARALTHYERYVALQPNGDAAVGKWIADLKGRINKPSSVAAADVKLSKKE